MSQGRFVAIMNHLALALRESHTQVVSRQVNIHTALEPGIPLFFVGGWGDHQHFGACLTPLSDSTLLVYKSVPDHPLSLQPGDRVLGYNGEPWTALYRQLLDAELPLTGGRWGSSPSSFDHAFLAAAGMNWHLFESMDIAKYGSSDTLHLSTEPLANAEPDSIFCNDQVSVPGIAQPDFEDDEMVTWGVVEGTDIGYIYVYGWLFNARWKFLEAVETLMFETETSGLIIDFRLNFGGNMFMSDNALTLLFDKIFNTIGFRKRGNPDDHFDMIPDQDGPPA